MDHYWHRSAPSAACAGVGPSESESDGISARAPWDIRVRRYSGDAATGGDEQRTVTYQQGAAMAAELGVPFVEVSSRTGENVPEAFSLLLSEVEKELGSTDSNVADPSDTCGDWRPLCDSGCDGWGKDGGGCTVG